MEKKLFKLNENGIPEWIIARTKREALEKVINHCGVDYLLEIFKEYIKNYPENNTHDFIDYFFQEEDPEKDFTLYHNNIDKAFVKTIKEFLEEVYYKDVPMWISGQDCIYKNKLI